MSAHDDAIRAARWRRVQLVATHLCTLRAWASAAVRTLWRKALYYGGWVLTKAAGAAALYIAFEVIHKHPDDPKHAVAGALIGLIGIALITAGPGGVASTIGRLNKISAAGIELGFEARSAAQGATAEDTAPKDETDPQDILDLGLLLEAKLAYVCKHVLAVDPAGARPIPAFATIGSLHHDEYLTDDQARTAARLSVAGVTGTEVIPAGLRKPFFEEAKAFVGGFRAAVFASHVRLSLAAEERGEKRWVALRVFPDTDRRRDLFFKRGDEEMLVLPALITKADSELLEKLKTRLRDHPPMGSEMKQVIVVPDIASTATAEGADGNPAVMKFSELLAL